MNTNYAQQAESFLAKFNLKFRAVLSDSKSASWSPSGHHYRVTISAKGRRITFDFFGSLHDMNKGIKTVSAYDVLSCISSDINTPDTFEDFCADYGYESDSIKALQTFRKSDRFAKRLRAFFTDSEKAALSEIQ